jgi:hypothetical protein
MVARLLTWTALILLLAAAPALASLADDVAPRTSGASAST